MTRRAVLLPLLGFFTAAFSSCLINPGMPRESLRVDGYDRSYLVHVPAGYDGSEPLPVVIMLHGFLESGAAAARITGFSELADREGFVAVFPDGVNRAWRYQRQTEDTPAFLRRVDDVAFLNALVDRMEADFSIDPQRLYVAGFSNGGFMAQRLACECPSRFAAVASVCASLPVQLSGDCGPCGPIPIALFGGTEDPILPWDGGLIHMGPTLQVELLSFPETAAFWAERSGCTDQSVFLQLPDLDPNDGTSVEYTRYGPCLESGVVDLYTIYGGGHAWPGGRAWYPERVTGRTSRDINASELIWEFFKAHPKGGK